MYFDSIELYFFRAFFVAFGEWVGGTGGTRLFHIFIDRNEFSGGAKISYLQRYEKKIKKKKRKGEKEKSPSLCAFTFDVTFLSRKRIMQTLLALATVSENVKSCFDWFYYYY